MDRLAQTDRKERNKEESNRGQKQMSDPKSDERHCHHENHHDQNVCEPKTAALSAEQLNRQGNREHERQDQPQRDWFEEAVAKQRRRGRCVYQHTRCRSVALANRNEILIRCSGSGIPDEDDPVFQGMIIGPFAVEKIGGAYLEDLPGSLAKVRQKPPSRGNRALPSAAKRRHSRMSSRRRRSSKPGSRFSI